MRAGAVLLQIDHGEAAGFVRRNHGLDARPDLFVRNGQRGRFSHPGWLSSADSISPSSMRYPRLLIWLSRRPRKQ